MSEKPFRPMLAATVAEVAGLRLPLLASPKLDGIRAIVLGGVVVSRNLKPIPNRHVQALFGRPEYEGLDGELLVGDPTDPRAFLGTTSAVMSRDGEPDVYLHAFDDVTDMALPFLDRYAAVKRRVGGRVVLVEQAFVHSADHVDAYERQALDQGFEGIMLRDANAPYKQGRGTPSRQDLMKLKRFEDGEARVEGFEELLHNSNEATTSLLGLTERGHSKDGMVGMDTLGALRVVGVGGRWDGVRFNVGSGFDASTRAAIWADRGGWLGRLVKFKFFPLGSKEAPRFPIFLGERHPDDL